ncbi:MAG: DUF2089 domain-containing protein [Anaerolineales bacterium]|nr:DUF2089 domain-containing protein [Anaerolineales bacterium]
MTVNEERMRVLQMLEEGKITVEEATGLLRALDGGRKPAARDPVTLTGESPTLRVHVTDLDTGNAKVNITLPFGLVRAGLGVAGHFAPNVADLDLSDLEAAMKAGTAGKIIEIEDQQSRERVEIYVE